jgi:hypothetical protein
LDLLEQVRRRVPAPPRTFNADITSALERVCLKAIEKDPRDRYKTGGDMAAALRAALQPPRWSRRKVLAGAALATGAASVGYWGWGKLFPQTIPPRQAIQLVPYRFVPSADGKSVDPVSALRSADLPLSPTDRLDMRIHLERDAYLYAFHYDQAGHAELRAPGPKDHAQPKKLRIVRLPLDSGQYIIPTGSHGVDFVLLVVTDAPVQQAELDAFLAKQLTNMPQPERVKLLTGIADPPPTNADEVLLRGAAERSSVRQGGISQDVSSAPLVPLEYEQLVQATFQKQPYNGSYYGLMLPHMAQRQPK